MKKDRDTIDDMLHSKLYDFEVETVPGDWEAIEKRLPHPSIQPVHRNWYYWAAAAVAAIAIVSSGLLWYGTQEPQEAFDQKELFVQEKQDNQPAVPQDNGTITKEKDLLAEVTFERPVPKKAVFSAKREEPKMTLSEEKSDIENFAIVDDSVNESQRHEADLFSSSKEANLQDNKIQERKETAPVKTEQHNNRKWGLGMGVGNLSAASNNGGLFGSSFSDAMPATPTLLSGNASFLKTEAIKEPVKKNIKHKTPLTFGIGASYKLADRWSLQSGLLYSYMVSEWETNEMVRTENKQKLHFIGIPVSVAYQLAEWKQIHFYLSAGGKVEVGVGGQLRTDIYSATNEKLKTFAEKERMKEPYFSVNGRIGASYPLLRFLSAYAEVGADYYFDNGSKIETYHSDKPLNFGLQLGLRFGL